MRAFRSSPFRVELRSLYAEADALLRPFSCDSSTDCCRFGRTGREPYPTAIEVAEIELAVGARGGTSALGMVAAVAGRHKRSLSVLDADEPCPLLSSDGRCRIYDSRPFGCRSFYCDRARGGDGDKLPRAELQALGRRIADLSARAFPRDSGPRPIRGALATLGKRR